MFFKERSHLRQYMRDQRSSLNASYRAATNAYIAHKLRMHPVLRRSQKIAGYCAIEKEIDLSQWVQTMWQGNQCYYLPIVKGQQLLFAEYHQQTPLILNRYNILEPRTDRLIKPFELDVVIVPLVAFDTSNHRLGRGAGYYDRSFSFKKENAHHKKPYLLGVGYAFQKVSQLTTEAWDIPLDEIIY